MQSFDKVKQRIQEIILITKLNSGNPFDKVKEIKPQEPEK